jgi:hypothetical protein
MYASSKRRTPLTKQFKVKLGYSVLTSRYVVQSITGPNVYVDLKGAGNKAVRAGQSLDEGTASILGTVAVLTVVPIKG